MKIAHLLPFSATFPLKKHNGRYDWALSAAKWQAAHGHDVTIYAGPDSYDESPIMWRSVDQVSEDQTANNIALIKAAFSDQSFDVFHSHYDYLPHTLLDGTDKPLVTTQHWFPDEAIAEGLRQNIRPNAVVVPVTDLMRRTDAEYGIHHSDVIYHGVDLSLFSYQAKPTTDRLLFVGRLAPSKGVKEAIEYAAQAGCGLDIIGKLRPKEQAYWDEISPHIDGDRIAYHGSKSHEEVVEYMQNARAMIFPSQQPEAFGLVTIEAQACGTPVIISDVGASSELVVHGKTGFVAQTTEKFVQAISGVAVLNRADCRNNAERFDIETMNLAYIELYEGLRTA